MSGGTDIAMFDMSRALHPVAGFLTYDISSHDSSFINDKFKLGDRYL